MNQWVLSGTVIAIVVCVSNMTWYGLTDVDFIAY
jgi:hypothetical protein